MLLLEHILFSNYVKLVKFRTYRVYYEKDLYYTVKWFMIVDSRTNVPEALIIQFYRERSWRVVLLGRDDVFYFCAYAVKHRVIEEV